MSARPYRRGEDVIEDVLDLRGEPPERICQRLGMTPAAITRALERHHRPDLAGIFRPLARGDHDLYLERERARHRRRAAARNARKAAA